MFNKTEALPYIENCTFIDCAVLSLDYFAILGVVEHGGDPWESTPPVHILLPEVKQINAEEQWGVATFKADQWTFPMVAFAKTDEAIVVDKYGSTYYHGLGDNKKPEKLIEVDGKEFITSHLRGLTNIHGTVYVTGNFRLVLRRDGPNRWSEVSDKRMTDEAFTDYRAARKQGNFIYQGFQCIDGFAADDGLYAGGEGSDVWCYWKKHGMWLPVDIGVFSDSVQSICCAADGFVYIGLISGTLLKGQGETWEKIPTGFERQTPKGITDLAWFKDKLYIATPNLLYEYTPGGQVTPVQYHQADQQMPAYAGKLDANAEAGWLISVGDRSAAIFNGEQWKILYGAAPMDAASSFSMANELFARSIELLQGIEDAISKK